MEKKVQLKEQELVGQEVVLSDIYPKTDTTSVEDAVTGASLDVKLDQIVEAINNKLTRVVNSVNNRTGVVVLDADDVGLGNVDNISFNTIKEWTIDTIEKYFGNKKLLFFQTKIELNNWLAKNDEMYDNTPFFVEQWDPNNDDFRSVIGCMNYDGEELSVDNRYRFIHDVKDWDNSITYKDGHIEVNVSKSSRNVLYKTASLGGLMVDYQDTGHTLYFLRHMYSVSDGAKSDGLLMTDDHYDDATLTNCTVYINNKKMYNQTSHDTTFKINDLFASDDRKFCHSFVFIENSTDSAELISDMSNMTQSLLFHQPLIGKIYDNEDSSLVVKLYTISPYVTWGLINDKNYQTITDDQLSSFLDTETRIATIGKYSNLQVLSHPDQYDMSSLKDDGTAYTTQDPTDEFMNGLYTPEGIVKLYETSSERQGGLFIPTDASLCAIPYDEYGWSNPSSGNPASGSTKIKNWYADTPYYATSETVNEHKGYLNSPTFMGVNLLKGKITDEAGGVTTTSFLPLSGLKVIDGYGGTYSHLDWDTFGMHRAVDKDLFMKEDSTHYPLNPNNIKSTGGLMVNVGKGLGIIPTKIPTSKGNYTSEGKVSVRLGKGFMFDEYDRITYNPNELKTNGVSSLLGITIKGIRDQGTTVSYDLYPSSVDGPVRTESMHKITLGDGLRISIEKEDLEILLKHELNIMQFANLGTSAYGTEGQTYSDYIGLVDSHGYSRTYHEMEIAISNLVTDIETNGDLTTAYLNISGIRAYGGNFDYDESTVTRCTSIYRLYRDEVDAGTIPSVAKSRTIDTLIANYATRHAVEPGDYTQLSNNTDVIDYSSRITYTDYTTGTNVFFESSRFDDNPFAKKFLNYVFNAVLAIKQSYIAQNSEEEWNTNVAHSNVELFDYDLTKSPKLDIVYNNQTYNNIRLDCSGIIDFVLTKLMGYDTDNGFTTTSLTKDTNPTRIKNADDGTVSDDFTYYTSSSFASEGSENCKLTVGDIVIMKDKTNNTTSPKNKMLIYGLYNTISDGFNDSFVMKAADFMSYENLAKFVSAVERITVGDLKTDETNSFKELFNNNYSVIVNSAESLIPVEDIALVIRYMGGDT